MSEAETEKKEEGKEDTAVKVFNWLQDLSHQMRKLETEAEAKPSLPTTYHNDLPLG